MIYDVIIIGGGPAGMTSAIYAAKREMKTMIIEKAVFGGYMQLTSRIENYPGFKKISGQELSEHMEEQVNSLDVEIVRSEVSGIEVKDKVKKVCTPEGNFETKSIILAVGGGHKKLEVKGEKEYTGKGVSYCSTCDAPFFKGRTVAVIGGGNSAISDALYLGDVAGKVYLIHRREELRAEESRQKELAEKGVEIILDTKVEEILGDKLVNRIRVNTSGEQKDIDVDGVFISIGTIPHSEIAKEAGITLDDKHFIRVNRNQETDIEGVYAAGDVTGGILQISTAVGEGCIAALSAYKYVKKPYWE